MRNTFRKMIGILLAVFMVTAVLIAATADDEQRDNEDERYEDSDRYESESNDDRDQANASDSEYKEDTRIYLADYYAGTKLDLEQYKGKVVILNYFTEWCPYCMEEMPDFKQILDTYNSESLVVLLVHPWDGEDASNSASVVEKYGLQAATVVEDEDFALASAIGVPGYPTTVIMDAFGYLSYAVASQTSFAEVSSILDTLGVAKAGEAPSIFTTQQPAPSQGSATPDATTSATP